MLGKPLSGAAYLLRGLGLVNSPGLRRYVVMPLLVNVLVFGALIWLAASQFGALVDATLPQLPEWLVWLAWLMWVLFAFAAALVVFFGFSLLANLIAAPFNALLAEAVERKLTGQPPPAGTSIAQTVADIPATLWEELRKIGYFARWGIPLLALFFIPAVNLVAPLLWLVFSAWMLAVEYADYPMGNHGVRPSEQRTILAANRMLSLGFGSAVMLATLVPLVNFLVMPVAVAGATALWVERLRTERGNVEL